MILASGKLSLDFDGCRSKVKILDELLMTLGSSYGGFRSKVKTIDKLLMNLDQKSRP